MISKGMTTMAIKQINLKKVYTAIYQEKETSKLQLVQSLQMGLSTVSQNLKELEDQELILKTGYLESTGGRRAHLITINKLARTSIGLGILKDCIHLVHVNLYGEVTHKQTHPIPYSDETPYYQTIGKLVQQFIEKNNINPDRLLGVSIAIQGIISSDGESVSYGPILQNDQLKRSTLAEFIPYPCRLTHDSKAAAYLELWHHQELDSAILLFLNENLGGAIMTHRKVHNGLQMRSGIIEHLSLNKQGPTCYCGSRGCLETYCSIHALVSQAKMSVPDFFEKLRAGDDHCQTIWKTYLTHLAEAIRNITVIVDGVVIISGHLAPYFNQEDLTFIKHYLKEIAPFPLTRENIILGIEGKYTPAIGAALYNIADYLKTMMV